MRAFVNVAGTPIANFQLSCSPDFSTSAAMSAWHKAEIDEGGYHGTLRVSGGAVGAKTLRDHPAIHSRTHAVSVGVDLFQDAAGYLSTPPARSAVESYSGLQEANVLALFDNRQVLPGDARIYSSCQTGLYF